MGIKLEVIKTAGELAAAELLKKTDLDEKLQKNLEEALGFSVDDVNEQFAQVQLPISAIGLMIDFYKVMKKHLVKENKQTLQQGR